MGGNKNILYSRKSKLHLELFLNVCELSLSPLSRILRINHKSKNTCEVDAKKILVPFGMSHTGLPQALSHELSPEKKLYVGGSFPWDRTVSA